VDICCTGQVSWQQLCSYLLLEYSDRCRASVPAAALQDAQPVYRHCAHNQREPTIRVVAVFQPPTLRYISVSKGGQVTVWNKCLNITKTLKLAGDPTEEVAHTKRFQGWVTDAVYMRNAHKVAISTDCRDIHFINVSTTNAIEDFHLYGMYMTYLIFFFFFKYPFEPSMLLIGDEMGGIHVLQFLNPTKRLFNNMTKKENCLQRIYLHHLSDHEGTVSYRYISSVHQDPVTRIMFEMCTALIMTSSESSVTSVVCVSMSEKQNPYIWKIREGVKCFDYNVPLQLIVTGGNDCAVWLWARYVTTCPLATLRGHHAALIDVAIYQPVEQIFSYSRDAVSLRIWDITTHECLKTIKLHFPCLQAAQIPEHGSFPFLLLSPPLPDEMSPHLLVGCKDYLALLSLSNGLRVGRGEGFTDQSGDGRSKVSLSCALYNPTLQQVVTGSTDSTVCVWDLETGRKTLHISSAHGEGRLSCMALDTSQRRLITGAHNGTVKVWNLLNGLNLHKLEPLNSVVTGLLCFHGDHLFAVGCRHCIAEYDLVSSKDLHVKASSSGKLSELHKSDICALAHCPALGITATASQKAGIIVWKLETQIPVLSVPPVDCLIFLQHRVVNRSLRNKGVLVSSQAGVVCFWSVTGQTHSYGQFFAPDQSDESVLTLSSNQSENTVLVSGDTAGWLHIWDISLYGLDIPNETVSELPPLLHCWRAHTGAVIAVEVLKRADRLFILSASADGSAGLWTQDGDHVGSFGQGVQWNLTDACSIQAER
ncbi:hypothetical protein NL108_004028, partial [Boleophthalmus pectinirostris]